MQTHVTIYEKDLTPEQREQIHKFGQSWIVDYDGTLREHWKSALWLWAWNRHVEFDPDVSSNSLSTLSRESVDSSRADHHETQDGHPSPDRTG